MTQFKTHDTKTTLGKATTVNQEAKIYGTFAEIGAGQEVARHFFVAGRASQTIAKTISAYDMIYSDEIYGKEKSGRYVCESRLNKMLEKEFSLLERRLKTLRGDKTCFFAFADTVATGSESLRQCHGWVGVRFQIEPLGPSHDIILHVRMLDKYRLQQQETLGILGVNLIYSAFYAHQSISEFLDALLDQIKEGQLHIDLIKAQGPQFKHLDTRLLNLELVRRGWTEAILFNPQGEPVNPSDELFKKAVLVQRGHFNPITNTHVDIFAKGREQFLKENSLKEEEALNIFEITMNELKKEDRIEEQDFLYRVDMLSQLKAYVLISNFRMFYQVKNFLSRLTSRPITLIIGANIIERIFNPESYKSLEGGMMEGLGKLFSHQARIFIYPFKDSQTCVTSKSILLKNNLQNIFDYYKKERHIVDIIGCDEAREYHRSESVKEKIIKKEKNWESLVPSAVADYIKSKRIYG